jgi:hypothetical protein
MWKPGQLVTIKGTVYRIKRAVPAYNSCSLCDFNYCGKCGLYTEHEPYPIPFDCYFKRLSP